MMNSPPLISIIIPAYNVEQFVSECIHSIYNQQYNDLEVIVVDDGSTDNTLQILKSFEEKYTNLKVLSQRNAGVSSARNYGLSKASGKYVYFLDSDDWLEPDFVQEVSSVCRTTQPDCVVFGYRKMNVSGPFISSHIPLFRGAINVQKEKISLAKIFSNENGLAVWDKVIKRSILIENNILFQNMRNAEDFIFSLDCYIHSEIMVVLDSALYNYRIQIAGKRADNYQLSSNQVIAFKKFNDYFDFVHNPSADIQNLGRKIYIKWFGLAAPLNIAAFKNITFKEKMELLKEQKNDLLLKKLSRKFSLRQLNGQNKFLLIVLKMQSALMLYLTGILLYKARRIYFK